MVLIKRVCTLYSEKHYGDKHCNICDRNDINCSGDSRVRLQSVRQQARYMVTLQTGLVTDNWHDWDGNVCTLTMPGSSRASL
jgi:hypothetical protein